jgi:uncharacterized protein (DUF2249 family)
MNSKWEELHPLTNLRKIPRFMSDHNPMLLCTELERQRKKQFCFETAWLRHPDFLVKVKETWEKPVRARNAADTWCIKLNRIKKVLKGWGANIKGHTKKI